MADDPENNMEAHLRAARDEAEQTIGRLKRKLQAAEDDNGRLREFGNRMAADKLALTKQNSFLTERVIALETENSLFRAQHQANIDAVLDMLEGVFKPRVKEA